MQKIAQIKNFWILMILLSAQVYATTDTENSSHLKNKSETIVGLEAAVQEAKLVVSEGYTNDNFGNAVSISGDYAIIGMNSDDFMGGNSGTAYIYHFNGSNWIQTQRLIASDAGVNHRFGNSVSLSGTQAVVGAPGAGTTGQVYVFDFDGSSWLESQILTPTGHSGVGDGFGSAVSLSANRILIGSPQDTGTGASGGAAYIFDYNAVSSSWSQTQKITATGTSAHAHFGISVSLYGFTAIIGAFNDENAGINNGSVYVFDFNMGNNTWAQSQKLFDATGLSFENFGYSVSLYNTQLVIGAYNNGNGSASVYEYDGGSGTWGYSQKLTASDGGGADSFGIAVSNSQDRIVVGAYQDDISGIANNLGSVYVFDFNGVDAYVETQKLLPADGGNFNKAYGIAVALDRETMTPNKVLIGAYGDDEMATRAGSAYVVAYDGSSWAEEQKMIAGDGVLNDNFADMVSISGETAVVGAFRDQDLGIDAGAVYVFDYVNSNWVFSQKLFASDATTGDFFGSAVSLEGTNLIIGAKGESSSGSVYVFEYDGSMWLESQKLMASDAASGDFFGAAVNLSGNRLIIGAQFDDVPSGINAGSAYIFDYDGSMWQQSQKLLASDGAFGDSFGISVAVDGDKAIIGAWSDDDNGSTAGSAYIFHYDVTNDIWVQQPKLLPAEINAGDQFGFGVSLEGDWAMVGAPDKENTMGSNIGAAYIYHYVDPNWDYSQKITAGANAEHFDDFGQSVSISGNRMLVAAKGDNENGTNAGAAYVFEFNGVNWFESQKLTATDGAASDFFGSSVALSGNRALIGAKGDDNNWIDDGAAYIINVASRYDLKINVTGFESTISSSKLILSNGNDTIEFTSDGTQILSNLADTSSYDVSITQQPHRPIQTCVFDDPEMGTILGADVTINVTCTTMQYDLSVRVFGLAAGHSIEVTNNLGDNLVLDTEAEIKTFPTKVDDRSTYSIDLISPQPTSPNQTCTENLSGTVFSMNTLRSFQCTTNQYTIGGTVTGLVMGNELVLQNNSGDDLTLTQEGSFVFATPIDDMSNYTVSIKNQPRNPHQQCTLSNEQGQLAGNNVDSVSISCVVSPDLIFIHGFENF